MLATTFCVGHFQPPSDANGFPAPQRYPYWSAMMLQFEAKHHLAMNMMEAAQKLFDEALERCHDQGFGELRGEIARDAFATTVEFQRNGFDLANQERYYRNMLSFETMQQNMKGDVPVFEDVVLEVSKHFWDSLYFPYEGLESVSPISRKKWEQITKGTVTMIAQANWGQLQAWFIENEAFLGKRLGDVRANTVLIGWLKLLYDDEAKQLRLPAFLRSDLNYKAEMSSPTLQRWRRAIEMLVMAYPKAVNLHDFKRQTPLMLAANAGDEAMVRTLLNGGADAEKIDFLGRTALHAATAKRSLPCVELILKAFPKTAYVKTTDGLCALHTALRMGDAAIVKELFRSAPDTLSVQSKAGQTPMQLADLISADPAFLKDLRSHMTSEGRLPATEAEYKGAASTLLKMPSLETI
jgi:Ankyrin repeats (3 copies)